MDSKISDVAKALGLSSQAVRLYEEKGILHCRRDEESGYRVFDRENIVALLRCRLLRSFGFPMADISTMLNDWEPEQVLEHYRTRSGEIDAEIAELTLVNRYLRRLEVEGCRALESCGTCALETLPAHYIFPFMEGIRGAHKLDATAIHAWNNLYPYRWDVTLLSEKNLRQGELVYRQAAYLEEPFALRLPPAVRESLALCPEQRAVVAWFSREKSNHIPLQTSMDFALRFVEEQGLTICGDTVVAPILLINRSSRKRAYFKASIPVE